jgi:hypothetical protein
MWKWTCLKSGKSLLTGVGPDRPFTNILLHKAEKVGAIRVDLQRVGSESIYVWEKQSEGWMASVIPARASTALFPSS